MKISLDELRTLPQHKLECQFKEDIAGLQAVKPVLGEITLWLTGSGVRFIGHVQTLLKLSCHRCLRPYFQALSVDIDERFVQQVAEEPPRDRELLLQRDFVEPIPDDGIIDISDVVYQSLTLATPVYCLCGAECPGPPKTTENDEANSLAKDKKGETIVDPRWKNLKTLFSSDENRDK